MTHKNKMILLTIGFVLIIAAVVFGIWHFVLGRPNPPLPQAQVTIVSSSTPLSAPSSQSSTATSFAPGPDQLLMGGATFNVEIASTTVEQARGLSYRTSLGANAGMLFIFSTGSVQSFWMKDMNFPLDIIWISGDTIVGYSQNDPAEPGNANPLSSIVTSPDNTDKVLEVNAGTVAKYNIKVGDTVKIGQIN